MSTLFDFVYGIPNWREPSEDCSECKVLTVHRREEAPGLVSVDLGGKQYQNPFMDFHCFPCLRLGGKVPLVYIGWLYEGDWRFRYKCPVCGQEGQTMYRGWKFAVEA